MDNQSHALKYHSSGRKGKIEVISSKPCSSQRDLSLAYTPGVAEPCLRIKNNPHDAYSFTAKGNLVAVITNGTAVLGLGNIGALASKPVMEGKGVLFKKFADIDVFDIELNTEDPDKFVETVKLLEPTFGAVNLEDIKAPECFYIEERLKKEMNIPVMHDDQHGTAIIASAALLNGLELVNKKIDEVKVVFSGAGAAGISCGRLYISLGVRPNNIVFIDSYGVLHKGRTKHITPYNESLLIETKNRTLTDALKGADVFVGLSTGNIVTKDMVKAMNDKPLIFAMANPTPEISYADAKKARPDAIVATGRSDFPNQVNNVSGFPFIFRGALDVESTAINEEMKIAAVHALVRLAKEPVPDSVLRAYSLKHIEFGDEYIIPKPFDPRALTYVAPAVAKAAMDSNVAQSPIKDFAKYIEDLEKRHSTRDFVVRRIINSLKAKKLKFVFPEGAEPKVLRAAKLMLEEEIGIPVLLGMEDRIRKEAKKIKIDLSNMILIDPLQSELRDKYANRLFELRQRKGVTPNQALQLIKKNIYFGMLMLEQGDVSSIISGVTVHYPDTIKPALEIIKIREGTSIISSFFLVIQKDKKFIFADPTINTDPTAKELAEIAINCAKASRFFEIDPKIAMLSFSNFGSVNHPQAKKMAEAAKLVSQIDKTLKVDGEMQLDTAISEELINEFYPFSNIKGGANILIFPDLQSANISYKLIEQLGNAELVGPLLMGLKQPVNVLPRGCTVESIVNIAAITALQLEHGTF